MINNELQRLVLLAKADDNQNLGRVDSDSTISPFEPGTNVNSYFSSIEKQIRKLYEVHIPDRQQFDNSCKFKLI
jgi:hypothetical protein